MTMANRRGFALLEVDRVREIARMGGRTSHANGTAHRYTPEEARIAGSKGGCRDPERMRELGRRGGLARRDKRQQLAAALPPPPAKETQRPVQAGAAHSELACDRAQRRAQIAHAMQQRNGSQSPC